MHQIRVKEKGYDRGRVGKEAGVGDNSTRNLNF